MSERLVPDGRAPSWWTTLPGVLTAVAAVITALTGLFVSVSALRSANEAPAEPNQRATVLEEDSSSATVPPAPSIAAGSAADYQLTFPSGTQTSLRNWNSYELVYTVLESSVTQRGPDALELELSVRVDNRGPVSVLVRSDLFRVLMDGTSLAPTNSLDDGVAAMSTEEVMVLFRVAATEADVILRIQDQTYPDPGDLRMQLRRS